MRVCSSPSRRTSGGCAPPDQNPSTHTSLPNVPKASTRLPRVAGGPHTFLAWQLAQHKLLKQQLERRTRELERERELMGPVNPLALEEYDALSERHEVLGDQLEDIRNSRRDLRKVIRSVDEEIVAVFAAAFAEVSSHFTELFESLFPGGQGRLRLTNPDDLLETGIEVEARPSGKNVKKLSLLSGGERSLTALAFLFAVFRSRPSPFYVMDEVEAALDDVNLHRFLGLVDQFRDDAQLVIVSHQKRTMEAADCLYGVSMAPGGSSKVISERVGAARAAESIGVLANG